MATILASIAMAAVTGLLIITLRSALLWIFISFFIAVVLNPVVDGLAARMPRVVGVALVLGVALAVLAGIGWLAVPPFVEQVRGLVDTAPSAIERFGRSPGMEELEARYHLTTALNRFLRSLPDLLSSAAQPLLSFAGSIFRLGIASISIFFLVLFMLLSGPQALRAATDRLPTPARERILVAGQKIYWATTRYALGTGFLALLAGTVATATLAIAGVPYFLPLGVTMVFLDFIPFAGFVTGGLLITVVTGATVGWVKALAVLAVFVVYQTLESHLLLPVVHHKTVRVSALGIVVALLIGLELAGILGVLFAVPVVGALRIVVREVLAAREEHRRQVSAAPPPLETEQPGEQLPH
ncbi:MAG: AI-2E family transporter [Deltaproteobacteria bacterium]|nr:AI-2E family transporter [Deltaproteobacteria bacterium]